MMERVLDRIPADMVKAASGDARKYFGAKDRALLWSSATAPHKSVKAVHQLTELRRLLRVEADASVLPHLDALHGLLSQMMMFRPTQRPCARECLQHDFFRENVRSLLPKGERSRERDSAARSEGVRSAVGGVPGPSVAPSALRGGTRPSTSRSKRGSSRRGQERVVVPAAPDQAGARASACDTQANCWSWEEGRQGPGPAPGDDERVTSGVRAAGPQADAPGRPRPLRPPAAVSNRAAPAVTRSAAKALAASMGTSDAGERTHACRAAGKQASLTDSGARGALEKVVAAAAYPPATQVLEPATSIDEDEAPPSDVEECLPFVSVSTVTPIRAGQADLLPTIANTSCHA
jgi:hypothetical protein